MTENREAPVHSLMVPMHQMALLLPNASVAEIIGYTDPETGVDMPEWMMGTIKWRGYNVPLVSYESMLGKEMGATKGKVRIAIFNGINGKAGLPFYGVVTQGIPRLVQATKNVVKEAEDSRDENDLILANVRVHGDEAVIPDLDEIENRIADTVGMAGKA